MTKQGPRRSFSKIFIGMAVAASSGCGTMPPGPAGVPPLSPPPSAFHQSVATDAWMDVVKISDPYVGEGESIAETQRSSIARYIEGEHFFRTVQMLPGKPAADAYVLQFDFTGFHAVRGMHPLAVPGSLLTLTLYIWVGGPMMTEDVNYTGTLTVRRPDASLVTRTQASVARKRSMGLHTEGYMHFDYAEERIEVVRELVTQAVGGLTSKVPKQDS